MHDMCAVTTEGQKALDSLGLEPPDVGAGSKLGSSARAASTIGH